MALTVRYEVDGAAPVSHDLLRFGERALAPEPALALIADILREIEKKRFDAEGPGWAPLKSSTLERKTEGSKIGEETRAMLESLTRKGVEGSLEVIRGPELNFGVNLTNDDGFPYPVVFDAGTTDETQAARPLFDLQPEHYKLFTKAVQKWLIGDMVSAGFSMGADPIPSANSQIFASF